MDGFDSPNDRIFLIGLDKRRLRARLTCDPIPFQLTELIEYGKRLEKDQANFSFAHLQAVKLVYAHMLAEMGLLDEALGQVTVCF